MNAEITRNILEDLLPAYLAGDASADTKALIEQYAQQDPEFARLLAVASKSVLAATPKPVTPDQELKTLHATRRRLHRRGWHLGLAIFFTFLTITYHIGPDGIHWTWAHNPAIAVLSMFAALFFWGAVVHDRKAVRQSGF